MTDTFAIALRAHPIHGTYNSLPQSSSARQLFSLNQLISSQGSITKDLDDIEHRGAGSRRHL
jgi:hypothetical protein